MVAARLQSIERPVADALALLICALGRALDFATTWVAIGQGRAVEAKPLAADLFHLLGRPAGMIAYEALITTPAIFLGCHLARRAFRTRAAGGMSDMAAPNAERLVFFLVGIISLTAAIHNVRFFL